MQVLKKLLSETAIYGLSSMVGRLLFFLLTPLYTSSSVFPLAEYGKLNHLFSISAFLLIIFGYGLETAYFRYTLKENEHQDKGYATALTSISLSTLLFGGILFLFSAQISNWLGAGHYHYFVKLVFFIVILDTLTSIPFAHLRATNQPLKFAGLKLTGIFINIGLNLFFYLYCPYVLKQGPDNFAYSFIEKIYDPQFGIGYAFVANIAEAAFKLLFLMKDYFQFNGNFSRSLLSKMLVYGWPIMVISFAGMINEVGDRQLLRWFLPGTEEQAEVQLGIYGACYKISIFLSLFTQAFRYAAEPFFFSQSNTKNAKSTYALVLKMFTIISLLGFLSISLNINIFKHFISNPEYYVGLYIVPILLMAYVFNGLYYNMSVWYKLTDNTKKGSIVAIIGALVTILVNIIFIPRFGYAASAWATFLCFFVMVLLSIFYSRKYYYIAYDWASIVFYLGTALGLYFLVLPIANRFAENSLAQMTIQFLGILSYVIIVLIKERKSFRQIMS